MIFRAVLVYALAKAFVPRTTRVRLLGYEFATWDVPIELSVERWRVAMHDRRFIWMRLAGHAVLVNPMAVAYMEGRSVPSGK